MASLNHAGLSTSFLIYIYDIIKYHAFIFVSDNMFNSGNIKICIKVHLNEIFSLSFKVALVAKLSFSYF